jgi:hypothetical protein
VVFAGGIRVVPDKSSSCVRGFGHEGACRVVV